MARPPKGRRSRGPRPGRRHRRIPSAARRRSEPPPRAAARGLGGGICANGLARRRGTDGVGRGAEQGGSVADDGLVRSSHACGERALRPPTSVQRRRRRVDPRRGGAGRVLVDGRELCGRLAPLRAERNQAGAGAYGEKKARMENRHKSNPLGRGWTNFADQGLNARAAQLAPFACGAPGLCVRKQTGAMNWVGGVRTGRG